MTQTFQYRLFDKRYGGEIGYGGWTSIEAKNKTEARKFLKKDWERDTPKQARLYGFVPFHDVKIVWAD